MQMHTVESSNIRAIGYDPTTQRLDIEFKLGTYQYSNVPQEVFDTLMAADSKGSYLNAVIKANPNLYPFEKLSS